MRKKVVSMLLATALVAAMVIGCSGTDSSDSGSEGSGGTTGKTTEAEEGTEETEEAKEEVVYVDPLEADFLMRQQNLVKGKLSEYPYRHMRMHFSLLRSKV